MSNQTQTKYKRAALWLCSRRALICSDIRDFFTSGGKVSKIGNCQFKSPVPQILSRLYDLKDDIVYLLNHPDESLVDDIGELWTIECNPVYYKTNWVAMMQNMCNKTSGLENIKIEDLLEEW